MSPGDPLVLAPLLVQVRASNAFSGPVTMGWSDRGWNKPFNDNVAPLPHFPPRLVDGILIERSLPLSPGRESRSALTIGEITLANEDGAFDSLLRSLAVDGRALEIRIGTIGGTYDALKILHIGTASSMRSNGDGEIKLFISDALGDVDRPIQKNLYLGTGGLEGGDDLKDKSKPLIYGRVRNAPAVLVDPTKKIYQIHDGAIYRVQAVYDGGAPLTFQEDVSDIMNAPDPAWGYYITNLEGGYIRLGQSFSNVTVDVTGDYAYGSTSLNLGRTAWRVLHERLNIVDAKLDANAFAILRAGFNDITSGIFIGTEPIKGTDFLNALFVGAGCWWGTDLKGRITVGRIEAPSDKAVTRIDARHIVDIEELPLPAEIDPAIWRVRVGYEKNWSVQTTDIPEGNSDELKAFLQQEYRYATASNDQIPIIYKNAQELTINSPFFTKAGAQAEADRLLALWGKKRYLYRITLGIMGIFLKLGQTINVTDHRFGLDVGRNALIIGQQINTDEPEVIIDVLI